MHSNQRKHLVSINFQFDTEQKPIKIQKQVENNQHKFVISVGYSNSKHSTRASVKNNLHIHQSLQNCHKRATSVNDISTNKYYFQRKNQKSVPKILQGVHTERKYKNCVTSSITKIKQNSKSYRIHTIDLAEDDFKKGQNTNDIKATIQPQNALNDITNRKQKYAQIPKNKLKKKSIINQSDLCCDFTTGLKNRRQKQQYTINLKHRKYNKVKTQLEDIEQQEQYNKKQKKHQHQQQQQNSDSMRTQKKIIQQILSKKVDLKARNKTKFISSESKRCTIDMKVSKKKLESFQQCQNYQNNVYHYEDANQKIENQQFQNNLKNKNFNNYIDFINRRKNENRSGLKILQSCSELKSSIINHNIIKKSIPIRSKKDLTTTQRTQREQREYQKSKYPQIIKQNQNDNTPKANPKHSTITPQCKVQQFKFLHEFDCSSIPQINNQSSFLSSVGKQQIIVDTFKVEHHHQHSTNHLSQYENITKTVNTQGNNNKQYSMKKKNKKKQPKKSIVCRSELKQMFPERFFI